MKRSFFTLQVWIVVVGGHFQQQTQHKLAYCNGQPRLLKPEQASLITETVKEHAETTATEDKTSSCTFLRRYKLSVFRN